jgi:predicted nucleic acid-binding protein
MILLDTKVVAEALRRRPHPRVIAWLNEQVWDTVYICAPSLGELLRALGTLPEWQRKDRRGVTVEEKILKVFANRILKYDVEAAQAYAAIIKDARRQKRSIGRQDALVAAVAKSYGIRVACFDASPFLTAGLICVEPWLF